MKNKLLTTLLACFAIVDVHAICLDGLTSLILSPHIGATIKTRTPVIVGIMKNSNGRPIKKKLVTIYVDNYKAGTISTNQYGVWSYKLKDNQILDDGFHSIQANIKLALTNPFWCKGTIFNVQAADTKNHSRSGNVSAENSLVNCPFEGNYINNTTPTVVGSLLDSGYNPVAGETVAIQIDGNSVGETTSDSNGIFGYALTTGLSDGAHTVSAYCEQSSAQLNTNNFVVDTSTPAAPTIELPTENETVTTGLVTVRGTTEEFATITTFMDDDTYGDVSYADEAGDWSIDYSLANGEHTVTGQASDLANNTSALSAVRNFVVEEIFS